MLQSNCQINSSQKISSVDKTQIRDQHVKKEEEKGGLS